MDDKMDVSTMADPLYIKISDFTYFKGNLTLLIFNIVKEVAKSGVLCVQRCKGVYKIYIKDPQDKASLLICGIKYNDCVIDMYECNPYDEVSALVTEKITIKNLPFHISNKSVLDELEGFSQLHILSKVMYSRERDDSNNLTDCFNGDRFLYVKGPIVPPLEKNIKIGYENCVVLHKTQKNYCTRCKNIGHMSSNLNKCDAYLINDDPERVLFYLDSDPLSNYYACEIKYQGQIFKSSEHAYQWSKTKTLGHADLADRIQLADTPAQSKKITEVLNNTDLENWGTIKMSNMESILRAKMKCCAEFRKALMTTNSKTLIEATTHPYWGCGLNKGKAIHRTTDSLPGANVLGELLMIIRNEKNKIIEVDNNGITDI